MRGYKDYLKSGAWAKLRAKALDRANGQCEFCGDVGMAVHHVRYPKAFKDDHVDNLVVVCKDCHELSHGIRLNVTQFHPDPEKPQAERGKVSPFLMLFHTVEPDSPDPEWKPGPVDDNVMKLICWWSWSVRFSGGPDPQNDKPNGYNYGVALKDFDKALKRGVIRIERCWS